MYRLDIQDYATGFAETEAFDDFTLLEAKLTDKVMICCNAIRLPRKKKEKANADMKECLAETESGSMKIYDEKSQMVFLACWCWFRK